MPADRKPVVKLLVGSRELSRWQSYAIESDLLTPADAFSFTAANPNGALAGIIHKGDRVVITVDDSKQMVGHVDDVIYEGGGNESTVEIAGRDLFGFLVDCSAPAISLHGLDLKTLAEKLSSEWITSWSVQGTITLPRIKRMKIEPGDSPLEVLQRFAEQARVAVWCAPDGTGVIAKPNYNQRPSYSLARHLWGANEPNNILRGRVTETWREQFSTVTVGGSVSNKGNVFGEGSTKFKGQAHDTTLTVVRPKNVSSSSAANTTQAKLLAENEVAKGQFEAHVLEYTVRGHYQGDALWQADTIAAVTDEVAGVDGQFYVTRRRFYQDESGTFTDLTLRQKDLWLA